MEHPPALSIEAKSLKALPACVREAIKQAEPSTDGMGKLTAAVLHQDGHRYGDALVLVRFSEFARLVEASEASEQKRGKCEQVTQR